MCLSSARSIRKHFIATLQTAFRISVPQAHRSVTDMAEDSVVASVPAAEPAAEDGVTKEEAPIQALTIEEAEQECKRQGTWIFDCCRA